MSSSMDDEVQIMIRTVADDIGLKEIQSQMQAISNQVKTQMQAFVRHFEAAKRAVIQAQEAYLRMQKVLKKIGDTLVSTTKSMITFGNAVIKTSRQIDQAFTRIVAVTALIGMGLLSLASNANEMQNKFNVVFGETAKEVDKWASNYANAINRSKDSVKTALAESQNLLVGFGMTRQNAAEFSKQIIMLTNDLSSFNNIDPKRTSELMMSALRGESEAAASLGTSISEARLKIAAKELGLKTYSSSLDEVTKMQIRFKAILMQSTDAIGDSVKTAWEFENVKKGIIDNVKQLGSTLGKALIPQATLVGREILVVVKTITNWIETNQLAMKSIIETALGFLKFAGTILLVVKAIALLTSPITLGIMAMAAMYVAWESNIWGIRDMLQGILDFIKDNPIISMILGFSTWTATKFLVEYGFKLAGEALEKLLSAALIKAGLEISAPSLLGKTVIAVATIGISFWLMSGGLEKVEAYLENIKTTISQNVNNWEKEKIFLNIYDAIFPGYRDFVKTMTTQWTADFKDWFHNNLGLGRLEKMFDITFQDPEDYGIGVKKNTTKNSGTKTTPKKIGGQMEFRYLGGLVGFDTGGYTGLGGVFEPAGIVHKGEYVIPKWMVNKNQDLISMLETQRLKGFNPGGSPGRSVLQSTTNFLRENGRDKVGVERIVTVLESFVGITEELKNSIGSLTTATSDKTKELEEYKAKLENVIPGTGTPEEEKIKKTKDTIKLAISLAIENNDLAEFKSSLGKSIYESARGNMIQAFSEAKVYQDMFKAWFDVKDLKFSGDIVKDFKMMVETSEELEKKLKEAGLGFDVKKINTELQEALKVAITLSLDEKSLTNFKSSLGESIYNNVKANLIKAFSESAVYQDMFKSWFDVNKVTFTGDANKDYEMIKAILEELKTKLKDSGLDFDFKDEKKAKSSLSDFASSLDKVGDVLENKFLQGLSTIISSVSSFQQSLAIGQAGGMLNMATGALGMVGAVVSVFSAVDSYFSEKNNAKNETQQKLFEDNTNALKAIGEQLENNSSILRDFSLNLISTMSKNPTLGRLGQADSVFSSMLSAIDDKKSFGQISYTEKWVKDRLFGSDKEEYRTSSIGPNIDNFSFEELKKYSSYINGLSLGDLMSQGSNPSWDSGDWFDSALTGALTGGLSFVGNLFGLGDYDYKGVSSSNFEEYKKNISQYIEMYQGLIEQQEKFFENATLESFEGISIVAAEDLRKQYEDMYKDLGLDPAKYKEDIEKMVELNQVLVQSTEEVRSSFISKFSEGATIGKALVESMQSYFSKLISNISSIVYDVTFSDFDTLANDYFKKFSDMLVEAKKKGSDVFKDISEFIKGSDTQGFVNSLVDMSKLNQSLDGFMQELRAQLLSAGLSAEDIDKLGIIDSTRKKMIEVIETIKSSLSSAIGSALESGDLTNFKSSLGKSIYTSAKESLIKAFSESAVYQDLFKKWFDTKGMTFTGDLANDFANMQDLLDELNRELIKNGLDWSSDSGTGSNSPVSDTYYQPSAEVASQNAPVINVFNDFRGAYITDEESLAEAVEKRINKVTKGV